MIQEGLSLIIRDRRLGKQEKSKKRNSFDSFDRVKIDVSSMNRT